MGLLVWTWIFELKIHVQ